MRDASHDDFLACLSYAYAKIKVGLYRCDQAESASVRSGYVRHAVTPDLGILHGEFVLYGSERAVNGTEMVYKAA